MLCCTSAPPTTLMSLSPEITGHVVGARKQTCGFLAPAACAESPAWRPWIALGGFRDGMGTEVLVVDTFEAFGGLLDRRVRLHPAPLLGCDPVAIEVRLDDRRRDLLPRATADQLLRTRQDL